MEATPDTARRATDAQPSSPAAPAAERAERAERAEPTVDPVDPVDDARVADGDRRPAWSPCRDAAYWMNECGQRERFHESTVRFHMAHARIHDWVAQAHRFARVADQKAAESKRCAWVARMEAIRAESYASALVDDERRPRKRPLEMSPAEDAEAADAAMQRIKRSIDMMRVKNDRDCDRVLHETRCIESAVRRLDRASLSAARRIRDDLVNEVFGVL